MYILLYILYTSLALFGANELQMQFALGQELPAGHNPRICIGYYPELDIEGLTRTNCPKGYAAMSSLAYSISRHTYPARVSIEVLCCPLPADDILEDDHVNAAGSCPDGYIATSGARRICNYEFCGEPTPEWTSTKIRICTNCKQPMRCTRVNSSRYQLGPPGPAAYLGWGNNVWKEKLRIITGELPGAMSLAFLRSSRYGWDPNACIGYPLGSLLTGKSGKRCQDQLYRQLQFKGLPGDPPAGTPVKMFPDCDYFEGRFSTEPKCKKMAGRRP